MQKMMPNYINEQTKEAINTLFSKFAAIYGNAWRNQFKSNEFLEFAKNQWAEALMDFSEDIINLAIILCRKKQKFPPSLPEFIDYCQQVKRKTVFYQPEEIEPANPEIAEFNLMKMKAFLNMTSTQQEK